jgi:hypothetical protein
MLLGVMEFLINKISLKEIQIKSAMLALKARLKVLITNSSQIQKHRLVFNKLQIKEV